MLKWICIIFACIFLSCNRSEGDVTGGTESIAIWCLTTISGVGEEERENVLNQCVQAMIYNALYEHEN